MMAERIVRLDSTALIKEGKIGTTFLTPLNYSDASKLHLRNWPANDSGAERVGSDLSATSHARPVLSFGRSSVETTCVEEVRKYDVSEYWKGLV
jgi:hypothetical protein